MRVHKHTHTHTHENIMNRALSDTRVKAQFFFYSPSVIFFLFFNLSSQFPHALIPIKLVKNGSWHSIYEFLTLFPSYQYVIYGSAVPWSSKRQCVAKTKHWNSCAIIYQYWLTEQALLFAFLPYKFTILSQQFWVISYVW